MKELELIKRYKLFIAGIELFILSCLFFLIIKGSLYYNLAYFFTKQTFFTIIKSIIIGFSFISILVIIISFINVPKEKRELINNQIIIVIKALCLFSLLCSFFVFIISNIFLILPISGKSMTPTIENGANVFLLCSNKINYNDIVIFEVNSEDNIKVYGESHYIKRVIGLPNDKITLINKVLIRNNEVITEDYFKSDYLLNLSDYDNFDGIFTYLQDGQVITTDTIPDGFVFVLGDNRHHDGSNDSMDIGLIPIENIIGIVKKVW